MMNSIIRAASRLALGPRNPFKSIPVNQSVIHKKWAHNMPLTYDFTREKIMLVLRLFDKIDPEKLTLDSHFINDLGLDSLDHVEIIMALEDDFNFEIPDKDAEKLLRPADILRYITDKEEAYLELQELQAASHHGHGDHSHEHGHDEHSHGHHGAASSTTASGQHTINQKREFSSWSTMSKRYASDTSHVNVSTFGSKAQKPVNLEEVQQRVVKVLSKNDKIDPSKPDLASCLADELGLDLTHLNGFRLFGIKEQFRVDRTHLQNEMRTLQNLLHPDRFVDQNLSIQAQANNLSAVVNNFYKILSNPYERGKYLLGLITNKSEIEIEETLDKLQLDSEFLTKMMELSETIHCPDSCEEELDKLFYELETELVRLVDELNDYFSRRDIDNIVKRLGRLKFVANCHKVLADRLGSFSKF